MRRFIFCNIGWMERYQGLVNDSILNGGEHVRRHGWGNEIFNFTNQGDRYYGYVEVGGKIKLERIGGDPNDDRLEDVTLVWTATDPQNQGTFIVGWYTHATLFRNRQKPSPDLNRTHAGERLDYVAYADCKDCTLLPAELRVLKVPRGRNGMGEKNIWYADTNPEFVAIVRQYIENGGHLPSEDTSNRKGNGGSRQPDVSKRILVEQMAVEAVKQHYKSQGFKVISVEKDNVGWDLIAENDQKVLKLEVKGLSGQLIIAELTPNEYDNMKRYKDDYRLCVVTDALDTLKIHVFRYNHGKWVSQNGLTLRIEEKVAAIVYEHSI